MRRELVHDPVVITSSPNNSLSGYVQIETSSLKGVFESIREIDEYVWSLITMLEKNVDRFTPLHGNGILIRQGKLPSPKPKRKARS